MVSSPPISEDLSFVESSPSTVYLIDDDRIVVEEHDIGFDDLVKNSFFLEMSWDGKIFNDILQ